jgi:glycogen operon protein
MHQIRLEATGPGQRYLLFADGPRGPHTPHRFDPQKPLIDPYARAITTQSDGTRCALVVDPAFSWGDAPRPCTPWAKTVIYEGHVRGMTQMHPQIEERLRGTYLGLAHPVIIEHLKALGVTAIQLLPVHHSLSEEHLIARGLQNYWGYSTLGFFAPDPRFASADEGQQVFEFKEMVKTFHAAGLEVLLDVVYNHTAEGNHKGQTHSFKGLDNASYYRLDPENPRRYLDVTGCGNTLNLSHPRVLQMVMDSLRAWVLEMGVDGFRFDLATALARNPESFDSQGTFLTTLQQDPVLNQVKLIAEPWDLGEGGYRLGHFPAGWAEWNDRYRDVVRRFWRADKGQTAQFATRLAGSADLFPHRSPQASINYITSHDGFTLQDLVRYEKKHNEANGEGNQDGASANWSRNWGQEGVTDTGRIIHVRERTKRNLMATLAFSRGVPMIAHGDELGRTQKGNNNAYCHDSDLTWINWELNEQQREFLDFCRTLFRLRKEHPVFTETRFFEGDTLESGKRKDVHWIRPDGKEMHHDDWAESHLQVFGMWVSGKSTSLLAYFNGSPRGKHVHLPKAHPNHTWNTLVRSAESTIPLDGEGDLHLPPHAFILLAEKENEPP